MNLHEALRTALRGLRANKLRSTLTTLGIVIGVSAVIILVALGNGVQTGFTQKFSALGTQIIVSKSSITNAPDGAPPKELRDSDVAALRSHTLAPDVDSVTPVITGSSMVRTETGQFRAQLAGSTADYLAVNNRSLTAGGFFDDAAVRSNARVVVLGPGPVAVLFGGDPAAALGKQIRIGRSRFTVIGVAKGDGQLDDSAIMPIGAMRAYLVGANDIVDQVIVKATSLATVGNASGQITRIMDQRHDIRDPDARDFDAKALQSLLDQSNQFLTYLALFTVAVAGISLVVGGIGIANITLVSVTERTREIGIRKAVGAKRSAILKQFLIESIMLAGMGGVLGIVVGVGITVAAAAILPSAVPDFPPPAVSLNSIAVAFTTSLVIGLLAGCYPAARAARLRPIDALRYE